MTSQTKVQDIRGTLPGPDNPPQIPQGPRPAPWPGSGGPRYQDDLPAVAA